LTLLGGIATVGFLFKTYLSRDNRFRIAGADNIQVSGLAQVGRAELLPVFGEDIGRNIFFVPLAERQRQLEKIPWVERATVMRLLPDQIRVSVVERQPVAFARQGEGVSLVDADGVLLNMPAAAMSKHPYLFPSLIGINPGDPLRKVRMAVYRRLLDELDSSGQKISEQISEIDLTDPENARVTMQVDTTLLDFGEDRFLDRYQRYKSHIAEWRQQYPKLAEVDLRYDRQTFLEMTPNPGAQHGVQSSAPAPVAGSPLPARDKPSPGSPATKVQARPATPPAPGKKLKTPQAQDKKPNAKSKAAATREKSSKDKKKTAVARRTAFESSQQKRSRLSQVKAGPVSSER
jgi:cell division protein FtsQ